MNVTTILSREPDGAGFYYGFLPCGRQLNVRNEGAHLWRAYVSDTEPVAEGVDKLEAERLGTLWAKLNQPE